MEDKCNRCAQLELLIEQVFKSTGYMDVYEGNVAMMCMSITQGIARDQRALEMYREAGQAAVEALDVQLAPGAANGPFT
jgi:hypothetical protein